MKPDEATKKAIKAAINYKPAYETCGKCKHYVPTDCSGRPGAKDQHCTFNPSFELPVSEGGRCDNFTSKDAKVPGDDC